MTPIAFLLVLISVFLHAGWNFLSKSKRPSAAFYMLASLTSAILWLPFFLLADIRWGELPPRFWLLVSVSGSFEVLYFFGLYRAYRLSDISLAYPVARALPVLLVALVAIVFGLGRTPGALALAGMAAVTAGCLLMPLTSLAEFRFATYRTPALRFIVLAAIGTTGYTVIDSLAIPLIRAAGGDSGRLVVTGAYLFILESLIVIGLAAIVRRDRDERAEFRRLFLRSGYPLLCGLFAGTAYALILLAMPLVSNVAYIQAFRQMSLPLGVLAGVFLLKEPCGGVKLTGLALVIAGLLLLAI
jgi:drug/metabolite transporter (DMT)-like permease